MRFINLQRIAKNTALTLGVALVTISSLFAQNSNTGANTSARANTTATANSSMANTGTANTTTTPGRVETNSTLQPQATGTPRVEATSTPRPQVQTVVEKENGFPWGLLGLLGLAGLIPKKRSVEVTGVRETTRETRTTTDDRDNKPRS